MNSLSENQLARWFDTEVKKRFLRNVRKEIRRALEEGDGVSAEDVGEAALRRTVKELAGDEVRQ